MAADLIGYVVDMAEALRERTSFRGAKGDYDPNRNLSFP